MSFTIEGDELEAIRFELDWLALLRFNGGFGPRHDRRYRALAAQERELLGQPSDVNG